MCGVIVVDAGRSRSTNLGRDAYILIIALDIVIIIRSSINCPTVICLPTVLLFSREKPLVKSTAPGSIFYYNCFPICFYSRLFSDLLFQKPKNTMLHFFFIYLFYFTFYQDLFIQTLQNNLSFYRGGIDNPSYALGCENLFFVCRYRLHSVAWFFY